MKKITSILAAIMVAIGILIAPVTAVKADEEKTPIGYVTMSVEKFTIGQGYYYEPTMVPFYENEKLDTVVIRELGIENLIYNSQWSYIEGIKDADNGNTVVPEYITQKLQEEKIDFNPNSDSNLDAYDYTSQSGWMFVVNNSSLDIGMGGYTPQDGDVVRIYYTIYGYGADVGFGWDEKNNCTMANKDSLTNTYSKIKASNDYDNIKDISVSDTAVTDVFGVKTVLEWLEYLPSLLSETTDTLATQQNLDNIDNALKTVLASAGEKEIIPTQVLIPSEESIADSLNANDSFEYTSEWGIIALARSEKGISDEAKGVYYNSLVDTLKQNDGILSSDRKYTEYSRVVIALNAMGLDPKNVGGYNLLDKVLNYDKVTAQGVNGSIYALIALDSAKYNDNDGIKEKYIQNILDKQLSDGGFALIGTNADPDTTAMALQALAPYKNDSDVSAAINKALDRLSLMQNSNGEFIASFASEEYCESTAQVVIALTALGIDPATDEKFVKESNSVISNLISFRLEDVRYTHIKSKPEANNIATEQANLAIIAYYRFKNNKTSLYNMSDVAAAENPIIKSSNVLSDSDSKAAGNIITVENPNTLSIGISVTILIVIVFSSTILTIKIRKKKFYK